MFCTFNDFVIVKVALHDRVLFLMHPQFLFAGTHMRDDIASEAYEDELDMGRSGSYLNSSITSAWSEHSLDPEDIRVSSFSVFPLHSIVYNLAIPFGSSNNTEQQQFFIADTRRNGPSQFYYWLWRKVLRQSLGKTYQCEQRFLFVC